MTSKVLPAIRQTGSYVPGTHEQLNDLSALRRLLGNYSERVEQLEGKIETDKPKVAFYSDYASADGHFGLQETGRMIGEGPKKFVKWLKDNRYVFKEGNALVPRVQHQDRGLFKMITVMKNGKARVQTIVTPKGVQYFAGKLAAEKFAYLTNPDVNMPAIIE